MHKLITTIGNSLLRMCNRGGNWNNGSNAGLLYSNLNNGRGNSNSNIGFRPAFHTARRLLVTASNPVHSNKETVSTLREQRKTQPAGEVCHHPHGISSPALFLIIMILLEHIFDFENLYQSYREARKGKRYNNEVIRFSRRLEQNLIQLKNELMWDEYQQGDYREFYVNEPKKRLIMALPFRDRVAQWAIYRQLYPMYDRKFIYDSYACRIGKGTHKALQRIKYWINGKGEWYYLKCDVKKFFYRIHHNTLIDRYKKHVKDERIVDLLAHIIKAGDGQMGVVAQADDYDKRVTGRGMAVGNLISQLSANVYMNALDQHVKHTLRAKYYARYMDDMLVIHKSKDRLWEIKDMIENFLDETLRLNLNNKTAVRKVRDGIDWVGFRTYLTHIKLAKKTAKRMKRSIKAVAKKLFTGHISESKYYSVVASYMGMLKHADCYQLKQSIKRIIQKQKNQYAVV